MEHFPVIVELTGECPYVGALRYDMLAASPALRKNLHVPTCQFLESDLVRTSQGQEFPEPSTVSDTGDGLNKKNCWIENWECKGG